MVGGGLPSRLTSFDGIAQHVQSDRTENNPVKSLVSQQLWDVFNLFLTGHDIIYDTHTFSSSLISCDRRSDSYTFLHAVPGWFLIFSHIWTALPSLTHPTLSYFLVFAQASLLCSLSLKFLGRNTLPYLMHSLCSYVRKLCSPRFV